MTPSTSTKKSPVARRKLMAAQTAQRPKSGDSGKMLSAALIMGKRQKKVLAGKVGLSPAKVATEQVWVFQESSAAMLTDTDGKSNGETLAMVTDEDVDMDISEDEGIQFLWYWPYKVKLELIIKISHSPIGHQQRRNNCPGQHLEYRRGQGSNPWFKASIMVG
ncbi:hypothetical protein FRB90_012622 [Tulasnella sp. 427]|nr:hypothetical protein FRB90_012622 [Tulasnella sp. 427]